MKIIFAGTPDFSVPCLECLVHSAHDVIAVFTQPDRPAGRGQKIHESAVKQVALQHEIPVFQPKSLKDDASQHLIQSLGADLMVVVAYGLLLPKAVLDAPKLGCINVHASLLPRWRGAAPIQRAILAGDGETGITIMQMDEGLDTGPMLLKSFCAIEASDTAQMLQDKLAALGSEALLKSLGSIVKGKTNPERQDSKLATVAPKITKEEARIKWEESAEQIHRLIRAFTPWPKAFTHLDGETVRIWEAKCHEEAGKEKPGTILESNKEGIKVAAGNGVVQITKCQLPGGRALYVSDILNSKKDLFTPGNMFA